MNDPDSMREIDATVRYLVLHIQNLERECHRLQNELAREQDELAREKIVSYGAHLSCENLQLRMSNAAKRIKSVLSEDDDLRLKTTRKLWDALESLGE